MSRAALVVIVATGALIVGCSGGDDATGGDDRPSAASDAIDTSAAASPSVGPTVPIAPPGTGAGPTEPVATEPDSTEPVPAPASIPPIEIRTFPDPDWAAVQVPGADQLYPVAFETLPVDPRGSAYDVSPDGRHIARMDGPDRLCLMPIVEESNAARPVCAEVDSTPIVAWAPDGSRVVFHEFSFTQGRSGTLGSITTDGAVTVLRPTDDPVSPYGGASASGFLDERTVVFTRVVEGERLTYEVRTIDARGSAEELVGTIDLGTGREVFLPFLELLDGTDVFTVPNGLSMARGIWRFHADSGRFGNIRPAATDGPNPLVPIETRGGLLVSADVRLDASTSNRDDARFFGLATVDGSTAVTIDDLDGDYMIVSAALSPDAAHLAVYQVYRGDDPAVANTAAVGRVSVATTESVLAGEPEWSTLFDVGPGSPSLDLDRDHTTITWPEPDRAYVELLDRVLAITIGVA